LVMTSRPTQLCHPLPAPTKGSFRRTKHSSPKLLKQLALSVPQREKTMLGTVKKRFSGMPPVNNLLFLWQINIYFILKTKSPGGHLTWMQ
jgi:hypothetical protein